MTNGESVGADKEADDMQKNDNLDPIEISKMENGAFEPDDDQTEDSSGTDGGYDGDKVSLAKTSVKLKLEWKQLLVACLMVHGLNSSASDGIADDFSIGEDDDMTDIYRKVYISSTVQLMEPFQMFQ